MTKKKETTFYQLTVTEKQLRLINTALEEYFRLGLNQWWDLADRLSRIGVDLSPDHPNHKWIFDTMIHTRDDVRIVLETAGRILWPHGLPNRMKRTSCSKTYGRSYGTSFGWMTRTGRSEGTVLTAISPSSKAAIRLPDASSLKNPYPGGQMIQIRR